MNTLHQQFLNFADKELLTSIRSSSLTVDGSEVENLISKRRSFHHQNAFLCEHYMKCPVEIFLTFPCLIDISTIIIEHKVSSHRSKEIELFAKHQIPSVPNRMKVAKECNEHEVDSELYPCRYPDDYNDEQVCKSTAFSFRFTGKYKEPPGAEETPDRLIFTNSSSPKSIESRANDRTFKLLSMSCTSNLMIRIRFATVPALRSLQVWGRLSNRNSKHVSIELEKLLRKLNRNKVVVNISPSKKTNNSKKVNEKVLNDSNNKDIKDLKDVGDIPEEFMDPLTFLLMTVPMMLPSGNTIDKTTLEKYAAEEEKHGRLPSDPFTGIVFQGSKVPIPNTSLKARIDTYLLKNSDLYKNGATTGYRNNKFTRTVDNVKEVLPTTSRSSKPEKRKLEVRKEDTKRTCSTPPLVTGNKHEDNMKNSLDLALGKVLSSLPKYGSKDKNEKPKCLKCEDEEFRNLFKLPCKHVCCRNCMQDLLKTTMRCAKCKKVFGRYNVTKLTVTS